MRNDFMAATALGSAAFVAAWSGQAVAQGAPNFDWAGPYLGASVGFNALTNPASLTFPSGGSADIQFLTNGFVTNAPTRVSFGSFASLPSTAGTYAPLIGTFSAGLNRQNGALVFGVEADASFSGLSKFTFNGTNDRLTIAGGMQSLFTLRPRVGVAVDRLLLFGTGGLAVGQAKFDTNLHIADSAKGVASADWAGSSSAWKTGFALGGGAEYAINDKLSVKFDALYYNLGTINVTATGAGTSSTSTPLTAEPYSGSMTLQGTVARVGLNFHL